MSTKNILIAVDSFKGSITSKNASVVIKEGLLYSNPMLNVHTVPIADGGEGTVEAFVENLGGYYVSVKVNDPLMRKISATYGVIENDKTAVIEMAAASGLNLLKKEEQNPLFTTSYGTGEILIDCLKKGFKKIIIGIGGSATNDGGIGLASALGIKFFDKDKKLVVPTGLSLGKIHSIDTSRLNMLLSDVEIIALSDVTNPLLGPKGASFVFAKQKGASQEIIKLLEKNMEHYYKVIKNTMIISDERISGAGSGGGVGFGLTTFLNAKLKMGIDFILDYIKFEKMIEDADYVITGEGRFDLQTINNKAPLGIAKYAKSLKKKVIGIAGIIDKNVKSELYKYFDYLYEIKNPRISVDDSMLDVNKHLFHLSCNVSQNLFR